MKKTLALSLVCLLGSGLFAQSLVKIQGVLDWERFTISTTLSLNFADAGMRLPTGRMYAEEMIHDGYQHLVRPQLLSLPLDSSTTLGDMLFSGEFSFTKADAISAAARVVPAAMSTDLSKLFMTYIIDLTNLSNVLIKHSQPADIMRTLIAAPAASYTGVIIIANRPLPVHGWRTQALAEPCVFPKIWDTEMNLIYERSMVDRQHTDVMARYIAYPRIFRDTPSGLDPEVERLVGSNPLRIIASGLFGTRPTDIIIDHDDALSIIASEDNRRLLREGKVAIVLDEHKLRTTF
ncbi:MAG: polymerase [Treponema sp.]|jgi:hypothetical protein|nr:polymerase [Treponema sp.]